jgi:ATP-dependent helicase/nuclease subunit B
MSLQIIYGNSGAGKSYEVYREVIEKSMAYPDRNYIILVPEQFTMQTQKELVSLHPKKGILNIDILSFGRLAYRIFEEVGIDARDVLEESGKSLVLRKAAADKEEELQVLGSHLRKIGYINEIKSVISELTQYNVSVEDLERIAKETGNKTSLQYKLRDIAVIYKAFKTYLEDEYITEEEVLDVLCEVISRSEIIAASEIILDGFTGFTPIQYKLLKELMTLSGKVTVTVTLDARESPFKIWGEHELFYLTKKTIHRLCCIAKEQRVSIEEPVVYGKDIVYRFCDSVPLRFLEEHLFRYGKGCYDKEQEDIQIHVERNPSNEAYFIARNIRSLVRENGYRYKDIAVIAGDIESYSNYIERAFEEYEIPCFIDNKRTILMNPFIEQIRSLLDLVLLDFSYESVFRYLRCNLSMLTLEEVDLLENYVIALGIRGFKRWSKKWVRLYKGMPEAEILEINKIREKFMKPLISFVKELRKKKSLVEDYTRALYEVVTALDIQEQLRAYEKQFEENGDRRLAKEYAQIYGIVMSLLDKVVKLLGDEKITVKEYKEILEAGFEETKVGIIPPSVDQIVVGDIERTRLKDIKVLFFSGINDGNIPKSANGGGIISEMEREMLAEQKIELAPTSRQNAYIQKFYLYLSMTKPSEKLYLSYSKTNSDGKALRPSYLINTVQNLFPKLEVIDEEVRTEILERVVTYKSGIPYLISGLSAYREGRAADEWRELYTCYFVEKDYKKKLFHLIDAAFLSERDEKLSKAAANALYGKVLENSVTRLEKYAACAFAHFIDYGLMLKERQTYTFEPMDMGNIFHHVLESFSKKLQSSEFSWFNIPDEEREKYVEECLEEVISEDEDYVLHSTARNEYMIERMKRIMRRTIWGLQEQIKRGNFEPGSYEVSFAMAENLESINIQLSEDEKLKLRGRIDRLDTYETDDKVYIKIIDYKSGNTSFDLAAIYHGLQLQLVVYLNAAVEMEKKSHPDKQIVPAGILYYQMKDPMVEREGAANEEEIRRLILKQLKMNGLVNSDKEVVMQLDKEAASDSQVLPVSLKSDGTFTKASSVAAPEQFEQLSAYVNEKIAYLGKEILNGNIDVKPYELGKRKGCDYCSYKGICGFDERIPGYRFRRMKEYKTEEVWKKLGEDKEVEE